MFARLSLFSWQTSFPAFNVSSSVAENDHNLFGFSFDYHTHLHCKLRLLSSGKQSKGKYKVPTLSQSQDVLCSGNEAYDVTIWLLHVYLL